MRYIVVFFVVFLSIIAVCEASTIKADSVRQNAKDQTVFFTLTDDKGTAYQWWADIPKGVEVQPYIDKKKDEWLKLIRKREAKGPWNIKHPPKSAEERLQAIELKLKALEGR